mmetsp:Transcript_27829/g.52195  ORF Transcript_27829/g.52195 Transcript_27829/m.52195 type:complete len:211 (+) Transcript_27829:2077-2709(+)
MTMMMTMTITMMSVTQPGSTLTIAFVLQDALCFQMTTSRLNPNVSLSFQIGLGLLTWIYSTFVRRLERTVATNCKRPMVSCNTKTSHHWNWTSFVQECHVIGECVVDATSRKKLVVKAEYKTTSEAMRKHKVKKKVDIDFEWRQILPDNTSSCYIKNLGWINYLVRETYLQFQKTHPNYNIPARRLQPLSKNYQVVAAGNGGNGDNDSKV